MDHDYSLPSGKNTNINKQLFSNSDNNNEVLNDNTKKEEENPQKEIKGHKESINMVQPIQSDTEKSVTYQILPGVQLKSQVFIDNLGYRYYKCKSRKNKTYLMCQNQKTKNEYCPATAIVSSDVNIGTIKTSRQHNHLPPIINVPMTYSKRSDLKVTKSKNNSTSTKQMCNKQLSIDQGRFKIKSAQDVHRRKLLKVNKNKKIENGTKCVYNSKLFWFNQANSVLNEVTTQNASSSLKTPIQLLKPSDCNNVSEDHERIDLKHDNVSHDNSESLCDTSNCNQLSSAQKVSPKKLGSPKYIVCKKKHSEHLLENTLASINVLVDNINNEDVYDKFGKYIASQLRELPLRQGSLLQQKIQNVVSNSIISNILSNNDAISQRSQHSCNSSTVNSALTESDNTQKVTRGNLSAESHLNSNFIKNTTNIIKQEIDKEMDNFLLNCSD